MQDKCSQVLNATILLSVNELCDKVAENKVLREFNSLKRL